MIKLTKSITIPILSVILFFGLYLSNANISFAQNMSNGQRNMLYHVKSIKLPADTTVVSKDHTIIIDGQKVPYEIIYGTLPVYGKNYQYKPIAYLFYYYFKKAGVKDEANRPILFTFNGGPGSASLWQMLGFTSPKRIKLTKNGFPVRPYGITDNHHSILDVTDLVYIDPVHTGFSRMLKGGKPKDFFTSANDTRYLARWLDLFISKHSRWYSPKFLLGESYGTTRAAGLAGRLEGYTGSSLNAINDIYLDGVILDSGGGGIGRSRRIPRSILSLPHYAAVAWYYKKLSPELENQKLRDLLPRVEKFAINTLLPAIVKGGSISKAKRQTLAEQISKFTGLSNEFVLSYNLTVPSSAFKKEILRGEGYATGGLDARYLEINKKAAGLGPQWQAAIGPWEHAFGPAMNHYIRKDLGFNPNLKYMTLKTWPRVESSGSSRSRFGGGGGYNSGQALRVAMEKNPALNVLFQFGFFDGGYPGALYASWQLDQSGQMQDRIHRKGYISGHMFYMREADLIKAANDIRKFIRSSIPKDGQPIKFKVHRKDLSNKK
jgi:carboxypeptidase C (cathepsin A)